MPDLPPWVALAAILVAVLACALWIVGLRSSARLRDALGESRRAARDAEARGGEALRRAEVAESGCRDRDGRIEGLAAQVDALREEGRRERGALEAKLEEERRALADLRAEHRAHLGGSAARERAMEERIGELKALREDMSDRFAKLADETMRLHGDNFTKVNDEKMRAILGPMRQQIEQFQGQLREAHDGATRDRVRLKTEIEQLSRQSEKVSQEAVALTNALKGDKQRQGAWGEMVLETLLESSGLRRGHEFVTQFSVTDEDGARRRPDAVVNLPGGRAVVIDSKVSLVAYERAVNAEDEEERERQVRAHTVAVKNHIDELAGRDYAGLVGGAVDYVLMFMPVEGALAVALEGRGDLTAYAIKRRVGIATPTTLMVALRTIEHVWSVERRESNAEEIAKRAGLIFDKMESVVSDFAGIGTALDRARQMQSDVMDRLARGNGNLLGQFDKMRKLGARTQKEFAVAFDGDDEPAAIEPPREDPREAAE